MPDFTYPERAHLGGIERPLGRSRKTLSGKGFWLARPLWKWIDLLRVRLLLHIEMTARVFTGLLGRFLSSSLVFVDVCLALREAVRLSPQHWVAVAQGEL